MVILRKTHKLAPVVEISEQLCQHIVAARPDRVGVAPLDPKKREGRLANDLVSQTFLYDHTTTVGEACRRSLVQVVDFVLFD